MARAMVQVDEKVKADLENLPSGAVRNCKTASDRIAYLIKYYHDNQQQKLIDFEERKKEAEIQKNTMIKLEAETVEKINKTILKLGLKNNDDLQTLLLDHFSSADQMRKGTFNLYLKLRG